MKINTPIFNDQQKRFALILLSLFHIFIITASNYFVQIPFEIKLKLTALGFADDFSFHSTWGTLTFPFIFLATDLTGTCIWGERSALDHLYRDDSSAYRGYIVSVVFSLMGNIKA